ncbi:MAG: hypothetical protein GX444_07855 [Myxococcales bacterium]|nr:hypothetical protein [Myxococcales bacterium]
MAESESGFKAKAAEWTEKLQALAGKVPGLSEFMGRENLREQDKLLREHTVRQLNTVKAGVDDIKRILLGKMQLRLLPDLDRLTQQLDRLRDKHRFDAYGFSGAFDVAKVLEPELQKLHETDVRILESVDALLKNCQAAAVGVTDEDSAKPVLAALQGEVKQLAQLIDSRRESVTQLGL